MHGEDRRHWSQPPRQAGRAGQGGRMRHRQAERGTGQPLAPQPAQPEVAQGWGEAPPAPGKALLAAGQGGRNPQGGG